MRAAALDRLSPDDASLTRALLAAYTLSNRRFPQTRFYFVIDFCRRLTLKELRRVRTTSMIVPSDVLHSLADFGAGEHAKRRIAGATSPNQIEADIKKMMQAVDDVFSAYSEMHASIETCEAEFLADVVAMKVRIDQLGASEGYLHFISPPDDGRSTAMVRSDNIYLRRHLAAALGASALALACPHGVIRLEC